MRSLSYSVPVLIGALIVVSCNVTPDTSTTTTVNPGSTTSTTTTTTTTTTTLAVPANLTAGAVTSESVELFWDASAGAIDYNVYQSDSLGGTYTIVGDSVTPGFIATNLTLNNTYYFKVSAAYATGESELSFPASAKAVDLFVYDNTGSDITIMGLTAEGKAATSLYVPSKVDGLPVTWIYPTAFRYQSNFVSMVIPSTVTDIGNYAFAYCTNLTRIVIPDSVTFIGQCVFYSCTSLAYAKIGSGLVTLMDNDFDTCTALKSVEFGSGLKTLKSWGFCGCTELTNIALPESLENIEGGVFYNCSNMTSVKIPDSVVSIGTSAFYMCDGLTNVTIGSGVTSIGDSAFASDNHLKTVIVNPSVPPSLGGYAFYDCAALTAIKVPADKVADYQTAIGWTTYTTIIVSQ